MTRRRRACTACTTANVLFSLTLVASSAHIARADVLCVPEEFGTIQSAINAAQVGDEVLIAPGVYTGAGNKDLDFLGMDITVRCDGDMGDCIINCEGVGRGFWIHNGESAAAVIDSIVIRNGAGSGGAIRVEGGSHPTIRNGVLAGNQQLGGGAGGGLYVGGAGSSALVKDSVIVGNGTIDPFGFFGSYGGGVFVAINTDTVVLDGCIIVDNRAGNDTQDAGGGITNSESIKLSRCIIAGNEAMACAGVLGDYVGTEITITDTLVAGNYLPFNAFDGGGVCIGDGGTIWRTTLIDNWIVDQPDDLRINEFQGGSNVINSAIQSLDAVIPPAPTIVYSNIGGGYPGEGNLDVDPGFVGVVEQGTWSSNATWNNMLYQTIFHDDTQQWPPDEFKGLILAPSLAGTKRLCVIASNTETSITVWGDFREFGVPGAQYQVRDYRLRSDSQLINAGDPDFVAEPGEGDLDGHARVLCDRVDIGAYEFGIGDYDCDLDNDLADFAAWQSCMTGPAGGPYADGCEAFDFVATESTAIDLNDLAGFQNHGLTIEQP